MKKKLTLGSMAVLSAIFIAGCGGINDDSTPEACQFEVSQALDKGNYDYVIQKLSSDPTCGGAYSEQEGKIQLAAAYIGKAGFDIPTLINDILKSDTNEGDSYSLFVQAIARKASGNTLNYLEKAKRTYEKIFGTLNCADKNALNDKPDVVKDACFYSGLVDTAKATTSVSLLVAGDETEPEKIAEIVQKWAEGDTSALSCEEDLNQNGVPDSADVSACALKYSVALSDKDTTNENLPYQCDDNGFVIIPDNGDNPKDLVFTKNTKNYEFKLLTIEVKPTSACSGYQPEYYKRLIHDISLDENKVLYTTAISNGYCTLTFETCNPDTDTECYPCPVITEQVKVDETTGETTIEEVPASTVDTVIETINEGSEAILAVIPEDTTDSNLEEQIIEFKKDLCTEKPEACLCDINGDGIAEEQCADQTTVENAQDIKIKKPSEDPVVQELIAEYLQNQ